MSGPIVFITTFDIHEGKVEAFKKSVRKSMDFIQANGPQVMAAVYLDEDGRRAHGLQVHRDSESILTHWKLADTHMRVVMQYVTTKRIEVYGEPSAAVVEGMKRFAQGGAVLTVTPRLAGFDRFSDAARGAP